MRLKTYIIFFLLLFCSLAQAASQCFVADINSRDRNLKKIFISEEAKGKVKVKFLYEEALIAGNAFFCYKRKGYKECRGDDDSGVFFLEKGHLKIKYLTIRKPDDSFITVKSNLESFRVKEIACK